MKEMVCKKCFKDEYPSFPTYESFNEFDILLTEKLRSDGLKFISDTEIYIGFNYITYQCENCKKTWCLSVPENAWRGYFLHKNNAYIFLDKLKAEQTKRQKGCIVFLIVLVLATLVFLLKSCD